MKIRRFNENSEEINISSERVNEIVDELRDFMSIIDEKSRYSEAILNELNNYRSESRKGNDQIDDSIAAFQLIKKDLDDTIDKLDTIINNFLDYNENGRKYLYTENK